MLLGREVGPAVVLFGHAVRRQGPPDGHRRIVESQSADRLRGVAGGRQVVDLGSVIEGLVARFREDELVIGAGTVLDPETARIAILAGAGFIVGPSLSRKVARMTGRYQIPYMPGAGSVAEVISGMEAGAAFIKVFPGEVLGPAFIKAVKAPLPQAPLMPTGGVSIENACQWIRAGAVALGVGGHLTSGAKSGDFASITALAKRFREEIQRARDAA